MSAVGTYGGWAAMRSNVDPATGSYRSPATAVKLSKPLSWALNLAKCVARSVKSADHAWLALGAASRAAIPLPAQTSRNRPHGVRGSEARNARVFFVIAG